MKIRGRASNDHRAKDPSVLRALPFIKPGNTRNLSLFGIAGGLLLLAVVTASGQAPKAAEQKASSMLSNNPLVVPKEEDKPADAHVESATAQTTTSTEVSSSRSTEVEVNGQDIPVPENGEVHRTITENGSHTTVDITSHSGNSSFSTDINVRSFSSE